MPTEREVAEEKEFTFEAEALRHRTLSGLSAHKSNQGKNLLKDLIYSKHQSQKENFRRKTELSNNPYWKRVWIIQEVSLARKIRVHYGNYNCDWNVFIKALDGKYRETPDFQLEDSVPLKLQKQLDEKYTDGHKLQTLLVSHQDALCKESRDKIYGFVGLATDCIEGYPLDYRKSLFEVWKDAVIFKNGDRAGQQHDIIQFGRVVQNLLGGPKIATVEEVAQDISLRMAQPGRGLILHKEDGVTYKNPAEILIPARLVGRICHLGPTYQEIISDLRKTASWRSSVNRYIPQHQRAHAREESEFFLEQLEELRQNELNLVSSYARDVSWQLPKIPPSIEMMALETLNVEQTSLEGVHPHDKQELVVETASLEPRLFLLTGIKNNLDSAGNMGLAPPTASVGDFVCQIHSIERAVLVRKDNEMLRIVGTAALADNHHRVKVKKLDDSSTRPKFEAAEFESISSGDRVDLFMDVALAYQLLN